MRKRIWPWMVAGAMMGLSLLPLGAEGLPPAYTIDLGPGQAAGSWPEWLQVQQDVATNFFHLRVTVLPPADTCEASLLLTAIFEDQPGGFLRVFAQTASTSRTLSDNLMEGISGVNQRTILIPETEIGPVDVTLQAGSVTSPLRRLIWTWVKRRPMLVEPANESPVALRGSLVLRDTDISGGPLVAPESQIGSGFVSVPLQDKPESINGGVDFVVSLDRLPTHARFSAQILSGSISSRVLCRINGLPAPELTPALPSFTDPSYLLQDTDGGYAGWLSSALFLPAKLWKTGENLIEIEPANYEGQTVPTNVSLKNAVLEFLFTTGTSPLTAPADSGAPLGTATPADAHH